MSPDFSRRDFLKASGMGAAALAAGSRIAEAMPTRHPSDALKSADLSIWVTSSAGKMQVGPALTWRSASEKSSAYAVVLDPTKTFQEILGFGAAFTDAACYMFNQLSPDVRQTLFHKLFHASEMGLNVCRTCIGASDYSTKAYSYDEGDPDPDLKRFSIEHDRAYILPMLREARKVNPNLFLLSSPWTPPGWMKSNNSMLGGNMRRQYMSSYANYFAKFIQGYEAEGIPIQAVTIQNEVDTDQDGRMPACTWPQEYEADFVRQHLGPTFERNGIKTKIWLIDHNYNLWGRAIAELETPDLHQYANDIAWHGYVGEVEWIDRVHQAFPDVKMHWTEGGPAYDDPHYADDWAEWSKTFSGILRHHCNSITAWNLALDEKGRPNIGPFNCGGLVTINSESKKISYSGQLWAFAHYSSFIRRAAHRFDTQSQATDLYHTGFENPDGQRVLVLTNSGAARNCELRLGQASASVSLATNSITTLVWRD